jgi:hypothetical protein
VLASGEILDYQLSSRDNWWSLHCQPIYNGIEFLLFMEFLKSIVLENGDAIASDIMGEAIVESGEGGVEREEVGALDGGDKAASVNRAEEDLKDVKKAGLQLMEKIVAAGVDQLNQTLQSVTGCVSGGNREDQENNNENERQVGDKDVERNAHSIEESTTTQTLGGGKDILSGMERKWLLFLTLRHPELLDVLCQNIWRQQQQQSDDLDLPAMVSSGRDLDGSNNSEKAAEEEAASDNPADKTWKLSQLCKDFEMGSVIQKEAQHAHLQQIMEDVKMGQLVKAAQHLQYLHEDFGPSESECRFVAMLHFLVAGPIPQFLQDCCSLFIV